MHTGAHLHTPTCGACLPSLAVFLHIPMNILAPWPLPPAQAHLLPLRHHTHLLTHHTPVAPQTCLHPSAHLYALKTLTAAPAPLTWYLLITSSYIYTRGILALCGLRSMMRCERWKASCLLTPEEGGGDRGLSCFSGRYGTHSGHTRKKADTGSDVSGYALGVEQAIHRIIRPTR